MLKRKERQAIVTTLSPFKVFLLPGVIVLQIRFHIPPVRVFPKLESKASRVLQGGIGVEIFRAPEGRDGRPKRPVDDTDAGLLLRIAWHSIYLHPDQYVRLISDARARAHNGIVGRYPVQLRAVG